MHPRTYVCKVRQANYGDNFNPFSANISAVIFDDFLKEIEAIKLQT